ncbi:hypothetical protein Q8A73_000140 [Channa argus]|nr:hypothetical protein Q8A73_000140 [Channa argus]
MNHLPRAAGGMWTTALKRNTLYCQGSLKCTYCPSSRSGCLSLKHVFLPPRQALNDVKGMNSCRAGWRTKQETPISLMQVPTQSRPISTVKLSGHRRRKMGSGAAAPSD